MQTSLKSAVGLLVLIALVLVGAKLTSVPMPDDTTTQVDNENSPKRVVGPITPVVEGETEIEFLARVDTGAKTTSLHAEEKQVIDGVSRMEENVGKLIRFLVKNRHGESQWLQRKIAEVRSIRTSEGEEARYLVPMQLSCADVEREVLVSLNDRSGMTYTMLLGRNFLAGEFLVDVDAPDAPATAMLAGE